MSSPPRSRSLALFPILMLALLGIAHPRELDARVDPAWYNTVPGVGGNRFAMINQGFGPVDDDFTVELWFRAGPQGASSFPVLCQKPAGVMLSGQASFALILLASNGHLIFRVTTTTGNYQVETPFGLLDNQWHHVAGVRTSLSPARLYLYVDGQLRGFTDISGTTLDAPEQIGIAALKFSGYEGNYFAGQIDELRIWGVARGQVELNRDRFREISDAPGLIAAFHFDQHYLFGTGQRGYLGSGAGHRQAITTPPGVSGLAFGAGAPPVSPGDGFDFGQSAQYRGESSGDEEVAHSLTAAFPGGLFAATSRPLGSANFSVEILHAIGPTFLGRSSIPIVFPVALAATDTALFIATTSGPNDTLYPFDLSDPEVPVPFAGNPILNFTPQRIVNHPTAPERLWLAGTDVATAGLPNRLRLMDTTNPMKILLEEDLGLAADVGVVTDVAATASFIAIPFDDEFLRVYVYTTTGGHDLAPWHEAYWNERVKVAGIPGTNDFVVAGPTWVSVVSVEPYIEVIASVPGDGAEVQGVSVSGRRAYVVSENGLRVYDVRITYPLDEVAYFATDDFGFGPAAIDPVSGRVFLAAQNAGLYSLAVNSLVDAETSPPSPVHSIRSYPNPTRGISTILLNSPRPGHARIEVFDVSGRRVRLIAEADFDAGERRLMWDGKDERGGTVRPGIYLCRARGDGWSETARLVRVE